MSVSKPYLFDHPDMAAVYAEWCEIVGYEPDSPGADALLTEAVAPLAVLELVPSLEDPVEKWSPSQIQRVTVALLAGAHLAAKEDATMYTVKGLAKILVQRTGYAGLMVANYLGTPTGYEGQADLLARRLHEGICPASL